MNRVFLVKNYNPDRNRTRGVRYHFETVFLPEILRQNGSCLFQHSKRNAPVQFPQSSLIAVVSKYPFGLPNKSAIYILYVHETAAKKCPLLSLQMRTPE